MAPIKLELLELEVRMSAKIAKLEMQVVKLSTEEASSKASELLGLDTEHTQDKVGIAAALAGGSVDSPPVGKIGAAMFENQEKSIEKY